MYCTELFDKKDKKHDVSVFDSGNVVLDDWLRMQAGQAGKKSLSRTYVKTDPNKVLGYYTLAIREMLPLDELPEKLRKKLPLTVPSLILARLAVDLSAQGIGTGGILLAEAMMRAKEAAAIVGGVLLLVDAKDGAADFYLKYGFIPLVSAPSTLFIRIDEIP